MPDKISVIIPLFNSEKYINASLNSILNQTLHEYEVIIVDDGSTDDSVEICDSFCMKDSRFHIIYQKNSGAAVARNKGLELATGEYVLFLDSDDTFECSMFEDMYRYASEAEADVCICGYNSVDVNGNVIATYQPDSQISRDSENYLCKHNMAPWNKLCRRRFLEENNIFFQNLACSNDIYFSVCVLTDAKKIVYAEGKYVNYLFGTSTQISARRDPFCLGLACKYAQERYKNSDEYLIRIQILYMCIVHYTFETGTCTDEEKKRRLYELLKHKIINKDDLCHIQNNILKNIIIDIQNKEYSNGLIEYLLSYDNQLNINKSEIIKKISKYSKIVLWGRGMRGKAFLKFCCDNDIIIVAVADKKNTDIGQKDEYGNLIVSTDHVYEIADLIAAGNGVIYESINRQVVDAINLQDYMPVL